MLVSGAPIVSGPLALPWREARYTTNAIRTIITSKRARFLFPDGTLSIDANVVKFRHWFSGQRFSLQDVLGAKVRREFSC
jgi:hypothetical protein